MEKKNCLESRLEKSKEALWQNKLALKKAEAKIVTLQRKRRTNILIRCGSLLEQSGLVNADSGEFFFAENLDEEVIRGFFYAVKNNLITENEYEFYRSLGGKMKGENYI